MPWSRAERLESVVTNVDTPLLPVLPGALTIAVDLGVDVNWSHANNCLVTSVAIRMRHIACTKPTRDDCYISL